MKWIVEFLQSLMQALESPFESCKSKGILLFAYFICPSVSGPKALKMCLWFAIFNFTEKLQNRINTKKIALLIGENIFGPNKFADMFLLFKCQTSYCLNLRANKQISFDLCISKGT